MQKSYKRDARYVLSGETITEIAQVVNKVNQNQDGLSGPDAKTKFYQSGEIRIKYGESGSLPMFSAVMLTDLAIIPEDNKFSYNTPTFWAMKATSSNDNLPFAICAEPANQNEFSKAVLIGVTPAKVKINNPTHEFAKPIVGSATGALESSESGTARIIWKSGSTDDEQWCILQLSSGSVDSGFIYNGYFKKNLKKKD